MIGYALTAAQLRRLRSVDQQLRNRAALKMRDGRTAPTTSRHSGVPRSTDVAVRITSGTKSGGAGNIYYPGVWQWWDSSLAASGTAAWVDGDTAGSCWVYPANGGTLNTGKVYHGSIAADLSGVPVFTAWPEDGSGTGTTIYAQGSTVQFSSSSSVSVAPGILIIPVLTIAGPPTWTPAAAGAIEYSPTDDALYFYDGSAWQKEPIGDAGGVTNTATEYTGTTTSAFVTVFDLTNVNGFHGSVSIKNTGGSNGLSYRWTMKDMFGSTSTGSTQGLVAGNKVGQALDATPTTVTAVQPYQEIKLEIEDQSAGSHTTYDIWTSIVG